MGAGWKKQGTFQQHSISLKLFSNMKSKVNHMAIAQSRSLSSEWMDAEYDKAGRGRSRAGKAHKQMNIEYRVNTEEVIDDQR